MLFLTNDELRELTGYVQPAKQAAHLKAQRIPFHTNRAGHPKVARAILEGRKVESQPQPKTWAPAWAANRVAI